ncbi:hypothetical protein [Gelatiniphilus marinus]|uniref:Uncharacterized protein n=1 Tax=Gelatiniphilus marinus TaxID=1759464 RepID=A0ABW5JXU6_9FLAO
MSKRGSRNATNFAGKNWTVGGKYKGNKSKTSKHKEKKLKLRKEQFNLICAKFNFKVTTVHDKILYDSLLKKYSKLRAMKGSRIAKKSIENVEYFKTYCDKKKEKFDIETYFEKKFNHTNFIKKYPELKFKENNIKREISKNKIKQKTANNTISEFISPNILSKLKKGMKK